MSLNYITLNIIPLYKEYFLFIFVIKTNKKRTIMRKIEFTKDQFSAMTKQLKKELIQECIEALQNGKSVTVDGEEFTDLTLFLLWIINELIELIK